MKGVTPHAAVLVCKKATARSIYSFIAAGIAQHIASLREAWIELISKLPSGTEGPFAMVGPQETDEQQRVSQQGLLVAFEADEEAIAGLLEPANRSHWHEPARRPHRRRSIWPPGLERQWRGRTGTSWWRSHIQDLCGSDKGMCPLIFSFRDSVRRSGSVRWCTCGYFFRAARSLSSPTYHFAKDSRLVLCFSHIPTMLSSRCTSVSQNRMEKDAELMGRIASSVKLETPDSAGPSRAP